MYLPQNSLTFGYDQARDAMHAMQIAHGDIKILGPSASTPGLYHGVLYYYVLAPAYLLGNGSPVVAAYWIAFLNSLVVFVVFLLARNFAKKDFAGLLAAFFYAISFEATQYATWLSNPTIGILTVPLIYLGLWIWLKQNNKWGALLAGIALGCSIQAEIFLAYHIIPALIWIFVDWKNTNKKSLLFAVAGLLFSVSTMILVEFKFGFKALGGLASLASSSDSIIAAKGFGDIVVLYLNQLGKVFSYNSYPGNTGIASLLVFIMLFVTLYKWNKKNWTWQPFLATWIFSHAAVVSLGGTSTPFLLVGIGPAVSILIGICVYYLWVSKYKLLAAALLAMFVFGSISMIAKQNPRGQTIFAIQKDMLLSKQLAAIDYTYESANKENFSINSLTSPLWINIVWTYLYKWHGQTEFGYLPYWHGRNQVGQLDTLSSTDKDIKQYYLILEPMGGIPMRYLDETISEEDGYSKLVDEKYFGELRIQKREKI